MSAPEPAADASWLKFESPTGHWLRRRWTVKEQRLDGGRRDPFGVLPEFWSRRRAERWTRKHTCEHRAYTVVAVVKSCH